MMLDKLITLLGDCDEAVADVMLSMAYDAVLDYIGRDTLPTRLENVVVRLAVIYYNRQGNEGETSRSEGGISQSFSADIPDDIIRILKNYPRKVGYIETVEE